jgi:hypothetical protein
LSPGTRFALPLTHDYEEAAGVLKITKFFPRGRGPTIKLEGELLEPWVGAVRDACTTPDRQFRHRRLDLAAVSYADTAGAQLILDLMREGIEITACSSFIGELLHLEDFGKPDASGLPESSPPPSANSDHP